MARSKRENRQSGFSLIEVMTASVVLSIFVLGVGGLYVSASGATDEVMLRQKAVFALNGEMERLSALYVYSNFGVAGPTATDSYEAAPVARLTYPADVGAPMGGAANNFVTAVAATFTAGSDFIVWRKPGAAANLDRAYIWIDREHNVLGRISWTATDIVVPNCYGTADDCECLGYSGATGSESWCRSLDLYIEYPYHFVSPDVILPPKYRKSLALKTIVGRV